MSGYGTVENKTKMFVRVYLG